MCGKSDQEKLDDPEDLYWCRLEQYTVGSHSVFREIRPYPVENIPESVQRRLGDKPVARMPSTVQYDPPNRRITSKISQEMLKSTGLLKKDELS